MCHTQVLIDIDLACSSAALKAIQMALKVRLSMRQAEQRCLNFKLRL